MKTFDSKKTERKFGEILEALPNEQVRREYVDSVKALRDTKITSGEGAYSIYFVTQREVIELAEKFKGSI